MASTQDFVPIADVKKGVVLLKDGSMVVVLETSAVNFGLLSENEQLAIISSFAGMINSLSFAIQIVIRSKRLDISNYLDSLQEASLKQTNPLLSQLIGHYRNFIGETVRENEVLDKQFFIVIPLSYLELGLGKNKEENFKKALTLLLPRRDHVMRQLARCGLRSNQLEDEDLVSLFFDIYNPSFQTPIQKAAQAATPQTQQAAPAKPTVPQPQQPNVPIIPTQKPPAPVQAPRPVTTQLQPQPPKPTPNTQPLRKTSPFVVEELPDDYGTL